MEFEYESSKVKWSCIKYNSKMLFFYINLLFCVLFCLALAAPQNPEINDQFGGPTTTTTESDATSGETSSAPRSENQADSTTATTNKNPVDIDEIKQTTKLTIRKSAHNVRQKKVTNPYNSAENLEASFLSRIYTVVTHPIKNIVAIPKVRNVLRNVGTCLVNGVMELISHYLPAPFIPLVASAAGMLIPFEPVVMLRDKMPVTSYRRALKSAVNSFLGTFDQYKLDDNYDDDPYMTMRFNRRMMNLKRGDQRGVEK